jgi:hypothetical protein
MGIPHNRHFEAKCRRPGGLDPARRESPLGGGICFLSFSSNAILIAVALTFAGVAAPAAAADELGRLFFTPQQRQDLDRRRATNRAEEEAPQIKEGPLTLDGHVQRSSGKTATWINGVPQYDSDSGRDPTRVTVVPNAGEPGVSLKVGEVYERTSGEVRDNLNGGEIKVGRPPPKPRPDRARGSAPKPALPAR